jgi:hypothetical protein
MPARRPARLRVEPLDDRLTPNAYAALYDAPLGPSADASADDTLDVAAFASGGAVAVWRDAAGAVVGQAFDPAKRPWGPQFTVAADSTDFAVSGPRVAAGANDQAAFVWTQTPAGGGPSAVYTARYGFGFATPQQPFSAGAAEAVAPGDTVSQVDPDVAFGAGQGLVVVTYTRQSGPLDGDVYYRAMYPLPTVGLPPPPPPPAAPVPGASGPGDQGHSAVAAERQFAARPAGGSDTGFAVAWDEPGVTGGSVARYTTFRLPRAGQGYGPATAVVTGGVLADPTDTAGTNARRPALDIDDAGFIGAAFLQDRGNGTAVVYRVLEPNGTAGSTGDLVQLTSASASAPTLGVGRSAFGRYVVGSVTAAGPSFAAETGTGLRTGLLSGAAAGGRSAAVDMAIGASAWTGGYVSAATGGAARLAAYGFYDGRLGSDVVGQNGDTLWVGTTPLAPTAGVPPMRNVPIGSLAGPASRWVDAQTGTFDPTRASAGQYVARDTIGGGWWLFDAASGTATQWAAWSPAAAWQDVMSGDVDGNGTTDVVGRAGGEWWVSRQVGGAVLTERWETWVPAAAGLGTLIADFDGDGKADIAGRESGANRWWVGVSTGTAFATTAWTTWNPAVTFEQVRAGDFDGDGKADIVGRTADAGEWWVATSTGTAFTDAKPAIATLPSSPGTGPILTTRVGDFNGDGTDDVLFRDAGNIRVLLMGGPRAVESYYAFAPGDYLDVLAADVNRDGKADVLARSGPTWYAFLTVAYTSGIGLEQASVSNGPLAWGTWVPAGWQGVRPLPT